MKKIRQEEKRKAELKRLKEEEEGELDEPVIMFEHFKPQNVIDKIGYSMPPHTEQFTEEKVQDMILHQITDFLASQRDHVG